LDFVEIVYRSGWLVNGYILSSFSQRQSSVIFKPIALCEKFEQLIVEQASKFRRVNHPFRL